MTNWYIFANEKVHSINGFSLGILTIEPRLSPVSNSGWLTQNQLSGILLYFLFHFGHSLSCWYIGSCLYIAVSNFVLLGFWIFFSLSSLLLVPTSPLPALSLHVHENNILKFFWFISCFLKMERLKEWNWVSGEVEMIWEKLCALSLCNYVIISVRHRNSSKITGPVSIG